MSNFPQFPGPWSGPVYYPPPQYDVAMLYHNFSLLNQSYTELKGRVEQLEKENSDLRRELEVQNRQPEAEPPRRQVSERKKKKLQKKRKRNQGLVNEFDCPYQECHKSYASSLALNLHIKLKHNGGTKKERETSARLIIEAENNGSEKPNLDIEFPPNYLQNYKKLWEIKKNFDK